MKSKKRKKLLDKCLDVEVTEHESKVSVKEAARNAKQKLEDSAKLDLYDWYVWWFGHGARKAAIGIVLIAALVAIASPLILAPLLAIDPIIVESLFNSNQTTRLCRNHQLLE